MTVELDKAIVRRWNAAGLDSSLDVLTPGGAKYGKAMAEILNDPKATAEIFGGHPESALPHYEYFSSFPNLVFDGVDAEAFVGSFAVYVFSTSKLTVGNACTSIRSAFNRSDEAGTDPMKFTGDDTLLHVRHMGARTVQAGFHVWMGVTIFEAEYCEASSAPA